MKPFVFFSAIGSLFLAAVPAAPAAAQDSQAVVSQFDDATIARLLLSVKATWRTEAAPQGRVIYRASVDGGINFTLMPRACNAEQSCISLLVLANFTGVKAENAGTLDAFLHRFNDARPTAKVYRAGAQSVVLQSYLNAVHGISFANAQAQLLVFGQDLVELRQELTALDASR